MEISSITKIEDKSDIIALNFQDILYLRYNKTLDTGWVYFVGSDNQFTSFRCSEEDFLNFYTKWKNWKSQEDNKQQFIMM